MDTKFSVSVVMATFNGGQFIAEQLDSIARQTHPPTELIVSDDASTDETIKIVRNFATTAPFPVKIVENEKRLGYGSNFLSATKHASGAYLSFCDQDDVWLPNKIEVSLRAIEAFDGDLYVHGATIVDAIGTTGGQFTQGIRKRAVLAPLTLPPWGVFYGFSMVFRRDVFDIIPADDRGGHTFEFTGSLSHDLWIYFIASSLGRVIVDPQPLVLYRRHDKNETPDLKGNIVRKISKFLGVAAHENLRRDSVAAHRSKILKDLAKSASPSRLRDQAGAASRYWAEIARFEADRITFYTHDCILSRLALCLKLLREGGYRSYRQGGLSWRLFMKDILFGVFQIRRRMAKN
ncbi:glycosyltransferase family 2 protein [Methylobacterium sp. J-048]|uniref:glycosyltransferase family 2 protein n=1 Tax=Methylobacterium sp. J-048 TaxID=2836635 RepID=UPI001FB9C84C|nr:glycosyltransferase family 2 protein [Methylobacterium sp. J-048]MCJ2058272.1 glycosyltransferase family 2 protein [Methylobacterium sp. J-048]